MLMRRKLEWLHGTDSSFPLFVSFEKKCMIGNVHILEGHNLKILRLRKMIEIFHA